RSRRSLAQLGGELQRVHGMHQLESPGHEPGLVALEMANQMPPNPQLLTPSSQLLLLLQRFLDAVLADVGQSRIPGRANRVSPESLGDGNDRHGLRRQSRYLGPHLRQTLWQGLESHSL